jgi:hypothetical protein
MSDVNPYAPPAVDEAAAPVPRRAKKKRDRKDIEEALAALDEHLADPERVAIDRKATGGRVRTVTLVLLALGAAAILLRFAMPGEARQLGMIVAIVLGAILLFLGIVAAAMDLSMASRSSATAPIAALKSYLRSFSLGRYGYAWACLSPTARAQTAQAPSLGAVAGGLGDFAMATHEGVKKYAATFARPAGGYVRSLQIKDLAVEREDGDVAVVRATLLFQSWPQWANILMGVGVATGMRFGDSGTTGVTAPFRLIGIAAAIAGLVGLWALRKRHTVTVHRTLLRGRNGAWYLLDPDLLEGATDAPAK